ncbi:calcium-binding protein [Mesorhizobium sp. B1-1-8]|uniref:calcium-binding protein n=1 Tax=Mesorhizobium sp. B1-1-8 TaxID=2589976 RepID=UPI00112B9119|nr:calcium-binding protein [Mesorhizobium sp. B1-1-8]UCI07410.1 calcium-binding protein [Mesorhizobium sp. B1-1-8]
MATLHYASGGSAAEVAGAGFNLVDVQYLSQVNALPDGMKGLVYLSAHDGVTQSFIDKVTPFLNNPKVFGFFLMDEPDPTGRWGTYASTANLKAESDWIHSHFPGAKTFITMMNMGSSTNPDFSNTYNPASTGIDYYGLDPYPVRTGTTTVDYNMIDRAVAAAVKSGIPADKIIPVYQAFGGGGWATDTGGKHVMPNASEMQTMMDHWAKLVPSPAFDYAYAWGSQNGDTALENSPELQAVFRQHNAGSTSSTPPSTSEPVPPTSDPTPPPTSQPTSPSDPVKSSAGDHIFHGTKGADSFHPTNGNDTYYANNAHDKVMEAANGGFDKVLASVSYALSAGSHVEQLSTTNTGGKAAINLKGNEFGQAINGNYGANKINGGGGADTMKGYGGNDTYYVDNAHDKVLEQKGGGIDKVLASVSYALSAGSSVEHLATMQANGKAAINLTGNELAQTIQGNAGANKINGGGGSDTLTGLGGKDTFVFNTALGAGNVDRITDFNVSQDKIQLDHSVFTGLHPGALSAANFHIGKAAHAAGDHIVYDSSTGALSFDSDGSGGHAPTHFATLAPHLSLHANSFFVV